MSSVAPALSTDHKKILQDNNTLGQEDEFYEITKNAKNIFEYKLKDGFLLFLTIIKRKVRIIALASRINCHSNLL
jgi:hypothetical protein